VWIRGSYQLFSSALGGHQLHSLSEIVLAPAPEQKLMMRTITLFILLVFTLCGSLENIVPAQQPLDGRDRIFKDELLDNLVGDWKIARRFKTRTAESTAKAEWILNHQFLLIKMRDVNNPPQYEANIYVGYDNASDRYVAHWIDVFGGRFSETLGYGARSGNSIRFVFEYPDGPFLNTFTWLPEKRAWTFLMQQKDSTGKWTLFAEDTLVRK
jgi:hypothetical protein